MTFMLNANPIPSAYAARPMDPHEIDAHPDAARIWATVLDVRDRADERTQEERDRELEIEREQGFEDASEEYAKFLHGLEFQLERDGDTLALGHNLTLHHELSEAEDIIGTIQGALEKLEVDLNYRLEHLAGDLVKVQHADEQRGHVRAELRAKFQELLTGKNRKLSWQDRLALRDMRFCEQTLSRILKKDELAAVAMIAMRALLA